ncbi:MAG TPA: hypothetical protein VHW70_03305 [Edaphobacter sp.]|jgi:hypothetical protein|nr:hypothetical protein [Edaphobacter sp.]
MVDGSLKAGMQWDEGLFSNGLSAERGERRKKNGADPKIHAGLMEFDAGLELDAGGDLSGTRSTKV